MVNSSYFGLSKKITSVNHAVLYVGLNTIKNLAINIAILGVMPRNDAADDDSQMRNFIITADLIAKELKIGYSGNTVIESLPQRVLLQFGSDVRQIITSLGDVRAELEKAISFTK
jgi:HD-like signal output (HDOD) protein